MNGAFDKIRVVDLSGRLSGAFAARQFADYGAEVLLIEPEGGHPLRHEPPFAETSAGKPSLVHAFVNWNKRSIQSPGDEALFELVNSADVLVTTSAPPGDDRISRAVDALPAHGIHL
ncbi:MAG: CoA transferase, partial [Pseudomonadales bacterium]|nr:CoA transferase [Pseudomonadales bacterium]